MKKSENTLEVRRKLIANYIVDGDGNVIFENNEIPASIINTVGLDADTLDTYDSSDFFAYTDAERQHISAGSYTAPSYTDNGDGTVTIGTGVYKLYNNSTFLGNVNDYTVSGTTFDSLTDGMNYIIVDYNSGSPILTVTTDVDDINESDVIPVYTLAKDGNDICKLSWNEMGKGLANKLHLRFVKTDRFHKESGLALSEDTGNTIAVTSGIVWYGAKSTELDAVVAGSANSVCLWYHSSGEWEYSFGTTYNNTQYDNGTNLATLTSNRYAVNWVFRTVDDTKEFVCIVLGTGDYTLSQALESSLPEVPDTLTRTGILIGRIIVQKSASSAYAVEQVSDVALSYATINDHNNLTGLQGGTTSEYYHLDATDYAIVSSIELDTVSDNELLVYDSGSWVNKTLVEAGILGLGGGTLTGALYVGLNEIGHSSGNGFTFDASGNVTFSADIAVEGDADFTLYNDSGTHKLQFDSNDWIGLTTATDVLYGYIGGNKSLQIGGSAVDYCNFAGIFAGSSNTGIYSNGFGYASLRYNTGSSSNGFGYASLLYNTGISSNGFGYYSLRYNTGSYSNGFGHDSLLYNTGSSSNGFGYASLRYNTGSSSNGFGHNSLRYNEGNYNTAIGHEAFNTFNEDSGNALTVESVDHANNRVTITGHGLGVAGTIRMFKASTTGALPTGLNNSPHQWKVIDANTIECVTDSFTDAGTGTHTLTPQFIYTNSTAIGYNAEPTASNQVMLGDTNVTEVKSAGKGSFAGANLNDNPLQNLKRYRQSAEPSLSTNGDMAIWSDSDDDAVYLLYKDADAGQLKIQFT